MKLETVGKNTSKVEVTKISIHGIGILSENEKMSLAYENFPLSK